MRELGPRAPRRGQKVQTDSLDGRPVAAATRRQRNFPTTSGTSAPGSQACASLDQRSSGWRRGDNRGRRIRPCVEQLRFVMPDLVPGIQALLAAKEGVEGRDNAMSPD